MHGRVQGFQVSYISWRRYVRLIKLPWGPLLTQVQLQKFAAQLESQAANLKQKGANSVNVS